jgi:signal transduction histidine kinase
VSCRLRIGAGIGKRILVVLCSLATSSALAYALKSLLNNQAQLLPFTLAVIAAATYGGLWPGVITTLLSFLISDYFFTEPLYDFMPAGPSDFARLAVFLTFGIAVSVVSHLRLRANLALQESNRRIELASQELARSNEELQRFAHTVAHDLREPLRGIGVFAELLLEGNHCKLDPEATRFLDVIVDSADHMNRLIDGLLDAAKAGYQARQAMVEVNTRLVAERVLELLRRPIEETGAKISFGWLPVVHANDGQLLRLFQNLIGNAIKYRGPNPPEIHISARSDAGDWVFAVRDNGIGIDPQFRQRVFEIFQRLENPSRQQGSGVGLAICKQIVESHGGRIWVDALPGQGSTFFFTIPREDGLALAPAPMRRPVKRSESGDSQSRAVRGSPVW